MDALVGFLVDTVALRHRLLSLPGRILLHAQATREFKTTDRKCVLSGFLHGMSWRIT